MQEQRLKYLVSIMSDRENQKDWSVYAGKMEAEGICCMEKAPDKTGRVPGVLEGLGRDCQPGNTLVITDDEDTAENCAGAGIACIGYCARKAEHYYFPHVQMVWESFEGMDAQELERFFCRFHGFPVFIARSRRLLLRESLPGDFETLRRMEQEAGWHFDVTETREKYLSYLRYAYSFYGYGYWTAELLKTGETVGWCGFGGWGTQMADPGYIYMKIENPIIRPEPLRLELGYLVDAAYRRQGLAFEMCRAALAYAFETLEAGSVWVKIGRDNKASLRLAEKLGFRKCCR